MIVKTAKATKNLNFSFKITSVTKDASGECLIEGYANTNDKDRVGDVVLPSAFEKSLATYMGNPILLFQHNWDQPCGVVQTAEITDKGLMVKARVSDSREDIKMMVREGVLRTFSIGYNELDSDMDHTTNTKIVKNLELLEISVVSIPANAEAKFTVDGSTEAPAEPAVEPAPADAAPKAAPKSALELKNFIVEVKSALGSELTGTKIIALCEFFNEKDTEMDKVKQLIELLKKDAPAATPPAATEPPAPAAKDDPTAPAAGDTDMAKVMQGLNAVAEACAKILEKLSAMDAAPAAAATTPPADAAPAEGSDEGKNLSDEELEAKELEAAEMIAALEAELNS